MVPKKGGKIVFEIEVLRLLQEPERIKNLVWIRSGSLCTWIQLNLGPDPNPDSEKCLGPDLDVDSVNLDS